MAITSARYYEWTLLRVHAITSARCNDYYDQRLPFGLTRRVSDSPRDRGRGLPGQGPLRDQGPSRGQDPTDTTTGPPDTIEHRGGQARRGGQFSRAPPGSTGHRRQGTRRGTGARGDRSTSRSRSIARTRSHRRHHWSTRPGAKGRFVRAPPGSIRAPAIRGREVDFFPFHP